MSLILPVAPAPSTVRHNMMGLRGPTDTRWRVGAGFSTPPPPNREEQTGAMLARAQARVNRALKSADPPPRRRMRPPGFAWPWGRAQAAACSASQSIAASTPPAAVRDVLQPQRQLHGTRASPAPSARSGRPDARCGTRGRRACPSPPPSETLNRSSAVRRTASASWPSGTSTAVTESDSRGRIGAERAAARCCRPSGARRRAPPRRADGAARAPGPAPPPR